MWDRRKRNRDVGGKNLMAFMCQYIQRRSTYLQHLYGIFTLPPTGASELRFPMRGEETR